MDPIKVGKYIAKLRRDKGITQEELAERINVSNKTISKWEVGVNIPDTNGLYLLSKEFNVPSQDILNGGEIQSKDENNDSIKNGINFYNKLFKKKFTRILFLVVVGLITSFSILYTISNYNRVQVYDITSNDENFEVKGYLIYNVNESIFLIDYIRYYGKNNGTDIQPTIKFYSIIINDKTGNIAYYKNEDNLLYYSSLSKIISNIKVSFVLDSTISLKKENINDFYMNIFYTDINDVDYSYEIKLNMKKHFSNNKIVY